MPQVKKAVAKKAANKKMKVEREKVKTQNPKPKDTVAAIVDVKETTQKAKPADELAIAISLKAESIKKEVKGQKEKTKGEKLKTKNEEQAIDKEQIKTPSKKRETGNKKQTTEKSKPPTNNEQRTTSNGQQETRSKILNITFQLKFTTTYGQELFITGNHELLGNGDISKAVPLQYFNNEFWYTELPVPDANTINQNIVYNYVLKNLDGTVQYDCGTDKHFNPSAIHAGELLIIDGWNFTGYAENAFYTEPFQEVLLKHNVTEVKTPALKKFTHTFKTKTPLLAKGLTLCVIGSGKKMNSWDTENPLVMQRVEGSASYTASIDLSKENFPVAYKYGVYDAENSRFVGFEEGNNRMLYDATKPNKQTIVNDAFANLPVKAWRGAGVAIPVFSLKTNNSFGVGEFTDIKALVDWSNKVGLKLIQILPVNDTTATHSWMDSYPYAAISAFALHPVYINLQNATDTVNQYLLRRLDEQQAELNAKEAVDYEAVLKVKLDFLKKIFPLQNAKTFAKEDFKKFFNTNKHWLVPYAVFCYLRDEYGTSHFNEWHAYKHFNEADVAELANENSAAYNDISFHYFIQYHLHLQLLEATTYAHSKGIIVKGDIPIGIYRYGADAWQQPHLYNMNVQAGAPPDDFAVKGQNWGFPTYNWQAMQADGFAWWRQRFEQMSYYFDAFRIDHILGFFRIWSIPTHAVEGILGHFVPAISVHINELFSRGIEFNHHRFTKPFITDHVLWEEFGYDNEYVKEVFVEEDGYGHYNLRKGFTTQKEVEQHFATLEEIALHNKLKTGLFNLISNVILFEVEDTNGQQFHFRFGMDGTSSFGNLDYHSQQQLKDLYVDYFFRRQDDFWMKEAMQKLPALRRVTNMLICGEDLGLVPACVPDVMKQLGLLSLEIQRMPKNNSREFFHPNDAPYLSVVTPSTHDMSTIRGWWEEDKTKIQSFYNYELGQWGNAPFYCEGWINKAIVVQHLYSPAMWAVFQLQDLLGMDEALRRENPGDERINVPANPKHYWQYRMNISLEDLQDATAFNEMLQESITMSGR